jgi:hypothetical protein
MKTTAVLVSIALIGSAILHVAFGVSLGIALLIFFVGWPLVGTLITIDEDLPGGWSNPDGTVRPPWRQSPFWGQITAGLAISAIGFAIDAGWQSVTGAQYWLLSIAGGFLTAALVTRKWWLGVGCIVGLGALWL